MWRVGHEGGDRLDARTDWDEDGIQAVQAVIWAGWTG